MPQFDPTVFLSQFFWLIICFVTVFFALSRRAMPRIAGIFAERSQQIEGQNKIADELKAEAAQITEQVEAQLSEAHQAANDTINSALYEINAENAHRKNEFISSQKRRVKASEKNIIRKKQAVYGEVKSIASETALAMTSVLVPVKVSPKKTDKILSSLLNKSQAFSNNDNVKVSSAS